MVWEPANDRARVEQSDTFVALSITKARANEGGTYKLVLKNVAGSADASFDVHIQNVPQPVRNLRIDNIHAESAHVTWEAPSDDGGLPITAYFVEHRDMRRSQYVRSERLSSDALEYELTRLTKGSKYSVRVMAENKLGQSEPTEIVEPFVAKNPFDVPSAPRELKVTGVTRSTCQLQWLPPTSDGGAAIQGYIVERQTEKRWIRAMPTLIEGTTVQLVDLIEGESTWHVSFDLERLCSLLRHDVRLPSVGCQRRRPRCFQSFERVRDHQGSVRCSHTARTYRDR